MNLSEEATKCLLMQRSCLVGVPQDELIPRYLQSCKRSAEIISGAITEPPQTAFDMGGGLGGVSICLSKIWAMCHFTVADYDHTDKDLRKYNYGTEESFAAYNSLKATRELLEINGVRGKCYDLSYGVHWPDVPLDLIFSVLSWGFHYPIDRYLVWARAYSTMLILDCRSDQGAKDDLSKYWNNVELIESYGKHEWYKCT